MLDTAVKAKIGAKSRAKFLTFVATTRFASNYRTRSRMKRIVHLLIFAMGFGTACTQPTTLGPSDFTAACADALPKADPSLQVVIVRDLQLKITSSNGSDVAAFLDNIYTTYVQDPDTKDEAIQRIILSNLETIGSISDRPNRAAIVPIIKDRPWLSEVRQSSQDRGVKATEQVYEDLNTDLVIVYAQDSPKNIRYLVPADLDTLGLKRSDLRALACTNLGRLLPKLEQHGENGFYMLTAGGDYEASLLLIDSVWNNGKIKVNGDLVVAIPTRDVLLVTGSRDPQGLANMRQTVDRVLAEGAYRITKKLFVRRHGQFEAFTNGPE